MLKILGPASSSDAFCDGLSRRNFLQVGGLGTGLSLSGLLAAEAAQGKRPSAKSVIFIYLVGGPPHQDMFDLKPEAPAGIRGEFNPIATNVPGIEIGEHLPRLAQMMDKFTIIRSICDAQPEHNAFQSYTGRNQRLPMPVGGWPTPGAVASKLLGPLHPSVPPYVSLCYTCTHGPYNEPSPGFLGVPHSPFRPLGPGRADLVLNGITHDRLGDRALLRKSLDRFRREADTTGMMDGHDAFTRQALGVLTSSRLANALDISQESEATRARYGKGNTKVMIDGNGAPRVPQSFLSARRLIEAGARIVTVNYSKWDWHGASYGTIFNRQREDHPVLDKALTALMEDLEQRGLLEDTLVGVWGEFGRTPKINKGVGRDHWPRVSFALLGGGSSNHGQVIGATDRLAGEPVARPVKFSELFATLYNHLGLDVSTATVDDFQGRPHYLVADGSAPIRELL
ncbi:MAG: hypothetical protein CMJ69_20105 [Planctomycetaceae bacterium]|nr:hypothetical protein [Planctomycetaceae bacterium]MCH2586873.1 DUF1501 domain-containing protein [Planctomycetales bacterium]